MPYFILLLLIGIPLFFLELAVGQRIRRGSIGVWNYVYPQLGGIGVSSLMVSANMTSLANNTGHMTRAAASGTSFFFVPAAKSHDLRIVYVRAIVFLETTKHYKRNEPQVTSC